jgi:flavin-dependent dehydrogenase
MPHRFTAPLRLIGFLFVAGAFSCACSATTANLIETDFCIYGGTSGGVVAAVQAARLGKSVVIVEPGQHLGGMTSGGLSWTDVGNSNRIGAVGGLARDVYERIGSHYGQKPGTAFDTPRASEQEKMGVDFSKPPSFAFEPHVVEAVFEAMVRAIGGAIRDQVAAFFTDGFPRGA